MSFAFFASEGWFVVVDFSQLANVTSYQQVFSSEGLTSLLPLVYYSIGIAVYGVIVWHFHKNLARRDIFELRLSGGRSGLDSLKRFVELVWYMGRYVLFFPLYTFVWFSVLSMLLLLLAKNQSLPQILLVSMAVVGASRIAAYYKENVAEEIAKILPMALLGVFLVDRTFLNFEVIKNNFSLIPTFLPTIAQYALYLVALEVVLRLLNLAFRGAAKPLKVEKK